MTQSNTPEKCGAELIEDAISLNAEIHNGTGKFLALLFQIEKQKSYREKGYSSLFTFLREGLKMSEGAAARRVHAVRAIKKNAECLTAFQENRVTLCALSMIAGVITDDNCAELLKEAGWRSKHELKQLVEGLKEKARKEAESRPAELPPAEGETMPMFPELTGNKGETQEAQSSNETMRSVESNEASESSLPQQEQSFANGVQSTTTLQSHLQSTETRPSVYESIKRLSLLSIPDKKGAPPLAAVKRLVLFVDDETLALLKQVEGYDGRKPTGEIFKRCLKARLSELRPRTALKREHDVNSRHLPKHLREEVLARDGHQCSFVSEDGHRCSEHAGLECDHIVPFAMGGKTELSNLPTLCRAHNQLCAEQLFGGDFMAQKREQPKKA